MLDRIARGVEIALRSGAAPLVVGARLARRFTGDADPKLPPSRGGLAVASKVALDEFFFATELAAAPLLRPGEQRRVADELAAALKLYEARGWLDAPERFHREPPAPVRASLTRRRSADVSYERLSFDSGYEPHAGEPGRERWLGYAPNRVAHAWILRHAGPPRPWVVCIPGYRMGRPLVDFIGFRARWLHRTLGLNVAIAVMPLHGPRSVGSRGGDGYFRGDFVDTVHAQSQAVWDARRLVRWVRAQGAPPVALYGVSLGAYTTALVSAMEPDLDCVVAGIPAADFARLVRSHVPSFVFRAAERLGFSFERIEQLLRVVSPFAFEARVPTQRCYLYAGLADRLASPDHAHDLWEHWGQPRVLWYHGSHVSFVWEPEVRALLHEAFEGQGIIAA